LEAVEREARSNRAVRTGRGPRDEADRRLLVTIAESTQALPFRASDLIQRADADPVLDAALLAADLVNPKEVGKWLARFTEHPIAGVRVERGRLVRGAMRWRVSQVCED
jgi:hypothetical protein